MKQHDNQVYQLRKSGVKVRVLHQRYAKDDTNFINLRPMKEIPGPERNNHGGRTTVQLLKNGKEVTGVAGCNPVDPFNRRRGLKIALGRALKQLESEVV